MLSEMSCACPLKQYSQGDILLVWNQSFCLSIYLFTAIYYSSDVDHLLANGIFNFVIANCTDCKDLIKSVIKGATPWWRHQMETFSALLALCAGNSPVTGEVPHKGQWRGSLMFSLIGALNNRLSKQSWDWWFETPSRSLLRHCNSVCLRFLRENQTSHLAARKRKCSHFD